MSASDVQIIKQGAEAKLYLGEFKGEPCLIKERFVKHYRHPDLDKMLTKERMRAESKALSRCQQAGILVPRLLNIDLDTRRIYLEYFGRSITVKQYISNLSEKDIDSKIAVLGGRIGEVIGRMHSNNIIHGDLTTSNMLLEPKTGDESELFSQYDLVIIDFGLAHYHTSAEDKGVDLYVLERALQSTHSAYHELFDLILKRYREVNAAGCKEVIAKYEDVRARGRKRTMIG